MKDNKKRNKLYSFSRYTLIVLSCLLILLSLLSLLYDISLWFTKIIDFPRIQYFIIGSILLVVFIILNRRWKMASFLLVIGLVFSLIIHGLKLAPYVAGDRTVPDNSLSGLQLRENSIGILLANVLIDNREASKLLQIIEDINPDVILTMEVDQWWVTELQDLKVNYPYHIEYPLDNAYGIALYSKFKLTEDDIKFLNSDEVPSVHPKIIMPSGKTIRFHGVHPVPPVPSSKYPDNVGEEEIALVKVGKMVARESLPSIVAGDFNDVSWSRTSRMFESKGNLNNVRIGRGFYNSFNAKSFFLRWPLDHYFVTGEFSLLTLERLPKFNSDHFPMHAVFVLNE